MSCACRAPEPRADPRRKRSCQKCGKAIDLDANWIVNDRTHNAFLDRVERTFCAKERWPDGLPPPEWLHFRQLALVREQEGRERFGFGYLERDNIQAGAEEASDGLNYTYFDTLQTIHDGHAAEWDLILTAAYHDFMAYRTRLQIRAKRRGSP